MRPLWTAFRWTAWVVVGAVFLLGGAWALGQTFGLPQPQPGDQVWVLEDPVGGCKFTIFGAPEGLVVSTSRPDCRVIVGHEREARL